MGNEKYYAGLDIGGTKCAAILASVDGSGEIKILDRREMQTDLSVPPGAMLERLCAPLSEFIAASPVRAVGISCGGPLDSRAGILLSPPNLPGWDEVRVTEFFSKRFSVPAKLENDANACACAEWRFGTGSGCENMVFCTMGTGFGAGLILNGRLYAGKNDMAGEIGHLRLTPEGPVGYGKRGSVEGYCSGGGIAELGRTAALEALQSGKAPLYCQSLSGLGGISAKSVAQAAHSGDETAIRVYALCGDALGRALAILIDLLNPEKIVIGSIFVRSEELIRPAMEAAIARECLPGAARNCEILPAALGEALGDIAAVSVAAGL